MRKKNEPMLTDGDYCVRLLDFDGHVHGLTAMDDDGYANVYINARLPRPEQQKAFLHEVRHVLKNDFSSETP